MRRLHHYVPTDPVRVTLICLSQLHMSKVIKCDMSLPAPWVRKQLKNLKWCLLLQGKTLFFAFLCIKASQWIYCPSYKNGCAFSQFFKKENVQRKDWENRLRKYINHVWFRTELEMEVMESSAATYKLYINIHCRNVTGYESVIWIEQMMCPKWIQILIQTVGVFRVF